MRYAKGESLLVKFNRSYRVAKSGCWEWTGTRFRNGYGRLSQDRSPEKLLQLLAHRFSYLAFVGSIPDGHLVCHHCDNPGCVNPAHLFTGTHFDNIHDCITKKRDRRGVMFGAANPAAKLSVTDVVAIRSARMARGVLRMLARKYGVSTNTIRRARRGETWKQSALEKKGQNAVNSTIIMG